MKPQHFVRALTEAERTKLKSELRSPDAFTLRRCQILLASADGVPATQIATQVKCARQTVHNALADFAKRGLACLTPGSTVPLHVEPVLTAEKRAQLQAILHQSPRNFDKPQSQWPLKLLAEVCHEQGLSDRQLSAPTLLDAVIRLGAHWKRARHWIVSPDPA